MVSSSSASKSSVKAEGGFNEELVEEVEEVVKLDEGFRTIITLRKKPFFLVGPVVPLPDWRPAVRHKPCREGRCIDASLSG